MRRLTNFTRDERGATAVLVAILLPALLLGMGALIITVGGWYVARGMDQNAADAAVIAVARTCLDDAGCDESAADPYVDGVANGKLAGQALKVCGTAPNLVSCSSMAVLEDGYQCPPQPADPYVSVLVAPRADDGSPTMKNWFSAGDQPVGACAQAVLGPPGTGTGIAVTISKCEWFLSTADGGTFAEPPAPPAFPFTINARRDAAEYRSDPADPATNFYVANKIEHPGSATIAGSETVLATHDTKDPIGTCGETAPGNFGWLESDNCYVEVADSYTGDTGNDPEPCYEAFKYSRDNDEPVYIPIYNSIDGGGTNASHDLAGFAAFVVTGWDITNGGQDWPEKKVASKLGLAQGAANANYCGAPKKVGGAYTGSNSDICIYGYFTEALVEGGNFSGGGDEDLGLSHAYLTG